MSTAGFLVSSSELKLLNEGFQPVGPPSIVFRYIHLVYLLQQGSTADCAFRSIT